MTTFPKVLPSRSALRTTSGIFVTLLTFCLVGRGQNTPYPADNSVWKAGTNPLSNAHSYIDASVLSGSSNDICAQINAALQQAGNSGTYPDYNTKAVIDARGVYTNLDCTSSSFPNPWSTWTSGTTMAPSTTVLLPAGKITINTTWTLPNNTQLIGEGSSATTISGSAVNPMIDMGLVNNANFCGSNGVANNDCNGVTIQHLTLSGGAVGIRNKASQEQSYVTDVVLTDITGTGLLIVGQDYKLSGVTQGYGVNSGPYSNIYFSGTGTCVNIQGTYGTRGIHGLTCIRSGTGSSGSAVLLDGSNNTIEDVFISKYRDGVVIGSQANLGVGLYSQSNVLLNIQGDSTITNSVVHICGPVADSPCPSTYLIAPPSDLTLMGIANGANSSTSYTVQDDMLATNLKSLNSADPYVGLYIVGEEVFPGTPGTPGNAEPATRFTTSPSVPTWYVGATPPTTGSCETGSLFSVVSGSSKPSLSLCVSSAWQEFSANN